MVEYACKLTSSECLSRSFTAVHEEIPRCMPKRGLRYPSRQAPFFAGSNPAVCKRAAYCRGQAVLRDKEEQVFFRNKRYPSAKREAPRRLSQSNASARPARGRIPCYPPSCQKVSFRMARETLKPAAAALAGGIANRSYTFKEDIYDEKNYHS